MSAPAIGAWTSRPARAISRFELARRVGSTGEVIGSDFSEEMLVHARAKLAPGGAAAPITFEWANAMALPYADGEFAAATVGFGARNFSDLDLGLREMGRVVRPGGKVVELEITTPTRPPLSTFYRLWFDRVVPVIGRVAGDPEAYEYLPNSVKRFRGRTISPRRWTPVAWTSATC